MARPSIEKLVQGIQSADRALVAQAITRVESSHPIHRKEARQLLRQILPLSGDARRIGISGVPGVGKSTFIESFGMYLIEHGYKVAVLSIDPSSTRTGGSILADKTRMQRLSMTTDAFVRPSPSAGTLGGVARATRETIAIVEAAGYDVVIVETVGVGQSEVQVSDMVDFFLVLMLAGAGDEFQGIKKGILEHADLIAINKADGNNEAKAKAAAAEYRSAMSLLAADEAGWKASVLTCSALTSTGLSEIWNQIQKHQDLLKSKKVWAKRRAAQKKKWFWQLVDDQLKYDFHQHPKVQQLSKTLENNVINESISVDEAATELLNAYKLPV